MKLYFQNISNALCSRDYKGELERWFTVNSTGWPYTTSKVSDHASKRPK